MDTADLFDSTLPSQEEEEEEFTAAEVLEKLEEAWLNEKNSPELLEPKMEIVESMLEQVKVMENNLAGLKKGDLRIPIHRMELSRIRFVINSYLRLRLDKIQAHPHHYTKIDSDNPSRLSEQELEFAQSFKDVLEDYFNSLVIRHLPGNFDYNKLTPSLPKPNVKAAVFAKVQESVSGFEIRDECGLGRDETIDLQEGDQYLLQYNTTAHLVNQGAVRLV